MGKIMHKYLALGFLFLMVACNNNTDNSSIAASNETDQSNQSESKMLNKDMEKFYLRLIEMIETASKNNEISDQLMQEIFSVYDEKLLTNSGPNSLNPFMECVKVHQDLLRIMKKFPKNVVENFQCLQNDFLNELQMLKTCKVVNVDRDCLTASRILEGAYIKFLLFHFSKNKDFYEKCIADAIQKHSFSRAIAAALQLKIFGTSPQRLIEAPKINVLRRNPGPGKILEFWLTGCCGTVHMEFLYVDEHGKIHKTSFPKQCKNKHITEDELSKISILATDVDESTKFCGWFEKIDILVLTTRYHDNNGVGGIVYFKFDPKNMKWIEVEYKDIRAIS
jgi:hypothetical protein